MKYLLMYLFGLYFIFFLLFYSCKPSRTKKDYIGKIIEKGYEPPTNEYKSHRDATYFVILYDEGCNCSIRIEVTVPTYYKLNVGSNATFSLDERDLYRYGNGNKHLK